MVVIARAVAIFLALVVGSCAAQDRPPPPLPRDFTRPLPRVVKKPPPGPEARAVLQPRALYSPAVVYPTLNSHKICQLLGDTDYQTGLPTLNKSETKALALGADLGVITMHKGRPYIRFGDTNPDSSISYAQDRDIWGTLDYGSNVNPDNCVNIKWAVTTSGIGPPTVGQFYPMITFPNHNIGCGGYCVPLDSFDDSDGSQYLFYADTLAATPPDRSVLAKSTDDGWTWTDIYDMEPTGGDHFVNVSVEQDGGYIYMFGTGDYRNHPNVWLARVAQGGAIATKSNIQYLTNASTPSWGAFGSIVPVVTVNGGNTTNNGLGEISVKKLPTGSSSFVWVMMYNCGCDVAAINVRFATQPWGPWSDPQPLLDYIKDQVMGFWLYNAGGNAGAPDSPPPNPDPSRGTQGGGLYGPYVAPYYTKQIDAHTTRMYWVVSMWNPYNVVWMATDLKHY